MKARPFVSRNSTVYRYYENANPFYKGQVLRRRLGNQWSWRDKWQNFWKDGTGCVPIEQLNLISEENAREQYPKCFK